MKERYIDLMELSLSAYTDAHIDRYFADVQRDGLTEHGFPRLTANIGILIAHGRRTDLLPRFLQMMEFCCREIPRVKAANDFSVREMICCLWEIEENRVADPADIARWKGYLAGINPETCYSVFARTPKDHYRNWALFTGVSEFFRQQAGLCQVQEFIDLQFLQQMQWLDENGMYEDNISSTAYQPIMYDLVSRGLFCLAFDRGYKGPCREAIDEKLKKAGLLTLAMQSPSGEIPFGGRSNQFIHNEAWALCILEYEAKRYARMGSPLAGKFKAAAQRAMAVSALWLSRMPIRHIKNRFPTETGFGCEHYAYFDKYMITVASNLYAAYLMCDDTIPAAEEADIAPTVADTAPNFHKVFAKAGGYGIEIDWNADPHYDAGGLGRVHRAGAPSAICMSCPCPAAPVYKVDIAEPVALSICPAVSAGDGWILAADNQAIYERLGSGTDETSAFAALGCRFPDGRSVTGKYTVSQAGVEILLQGNGDIGCALPAFAFDGEVSAEITLEENSLTVAYGGWLCRYTTDGKIRDLHMLAANRNGHYKAFLAAGTDTLQVKVEIIRAG